MNSVNNTSRVLGTAFLLQSVMPMISNILLLNPLIVPNKIIETMTNFANNPLQVRAGILGEMITALGIIFLGVILFITLRKQNEKMALVGLGFYILEAALIAVSRTADLSLLRISQESVITGNPAYLQSMGNVTLDTMHFLYSLSMAAFSFGGPLFYYLLFKAGIVPRSLSLWGLITAICPCLIATLVSILGYEVPFFVYLPYAPFEVVIGIWILVKSIPDTKLQSVGNA